MTQINNAEFTMFNKTEAKVAARMTAAALAFERGAHVKIIEGDLHAAGISIMKTLKQSRIIINVRKAEEPGCKGWRVVVFASPSGLKGMHCVGFAGNCAAAYNLGAKVVKSIAAKEAGVEEAFPAV